MAARKRKDPSPELVAALQTLYVCMLTGFEQFHRQEHRFEVRYRYKVLQDRFDKLVDCAHDWRADVLDRLEELHLDFESKIDPFVVESDVKLAYEQTLDRLRDMAEEIQAAIKAAAAEYDCPTEEMLEDLAVEVEKKIVKVEAWLEQVADMGAAYLTTLV
jgi:hypothetical protein